MMVHDYGPGRQFASLHVEFPTEVDPLEAHDLIDNIEHDVWEEMHLLLTIHYDPIVTSDARVGVLRARLNEEIHRIDPTLSMHDLRLVPGSTHTNVLFDLVFPAGYSGDKQAVRQKLEAFASQQDPTYICKNQGGAELHRSSRRPSGPDGQEGGILMLNEMYRRMLAHKSVIRETGRLRPPAGRRDRL